jgi:hypothetical protein
MLGDAFIESIYCSPVIPHFVFYIQNNYSQKAILSSIIIKIDSYKYAGDSMTEIVLPFNFFLIKRKLTFYEY